MKLTRTWRVWWLLSALPLISACVTKPQNLPGVTVRPPVIPALPSQARQSPTPLACSPSCLGSLTEWRKSTRRKLTAPASPD